MSNNEGMLVHLLDNFVLKRYVSGIYNGNCLLQAFFLNELSFLGEYLGMESCLVCLPS